MTLGPRGRRLLLFGLVAAIVGVAVLVWRSRRPVLVPRAVWVWSDRVMRDPLAADSLFEWARRHRVGRLFQHVEPLLMEDPEAVARFLRRARSDGFVVEALLGDPAWLTAPDSALTRVDRLLGMHDRLGTDTLAAMHFDVEPHALPEWRRRQGVLVRRFQSLVEQVRARRGDRSIPLHFDIPVWYDEVRLPDAPATSVAAWLVRRVDGVTLMAYVTDRRSLWPILARASGWAGRSGATWSVGLETACDAGPDASYCTLGRARLEETLAAMERRFGRAPKWAGPAIHFYPDATRLLP